jgi:50S ribosomal protein L16 3-hydroxylase
VNVTARPQLADLVAPLSPDGFLAEHWAGGLAHLSRPDPGLVARLKSIDGLASPEALLARHRLDVRIFGPNAFRSVVPARSARDFLAAGYNLYITGVEETVPEVRRLLADVAGGLQMAPWQLHVEAFAGMAGGVSSRHYDHDINFQILLDGEKEWLLEENRNIRNPLQSFHPVVDRAGAWSGLKEEVFAADPVMPPAFDPERARKLRATAGTTLFLPRGVWHETRSVTDTWGVNLVLRSVTWARAIGKAIEIRLHEDPAFRAYCGGVAVDHPIPDALRARQLETFRSATEAAAAALGDLSMEEVVLSLLSFIGQSYQWTTAAAARQVVEREGSWFLVVPGVLSEPWKLEDRHVAAATKLCALREAFTWNHLRCLASDVAAGDLHRMITRLVAAGLIDVKP